VASLARGAIKFVPGIGPVADSALNIAEKAYAAARATPGAAAVAPPAAAPVTPRGYTCTYF
jgi:hypothetical protein